MVIWFGLPKIRKPEWRVEVRKKGDISLMKITIPISTALRTETAPDVLWRGEDKGLIQAWEIGRRQALKGGDLIERAKRGELPASDLFQGGYDERLNAAVQYGSMHYYCMWLGWRGQDLELETDDEYPVVCSKTRMGVVYTVSSEKYLQQGMSKADERNYGLDFLAKVNGAPNGTQANSLL